MALGPKDWSPYPEHDAPIIREALKKLAPGIAVSVSREEDVNFVWDGDGEDPREEGWIPYDVYVYARAIVGGEQVEGRASIGGVYDKPGKFDPDINGYFPQMLKEALQELSEQLLGPVREQTEAALAYLKKYMKMMYERDKNRKYRHRS